MRWVAPTERDTANQTLEKRLWDAACSIRGAKDAAIWWSDPGLPLRGLGVLCGEAFLLPRVHRGLMREPSRSESEG
jgi:hypothetical protein